MSLRKQIQELSADTGVSDLSSGSYLYVSDALTMSMVNGPGPRTVLWVQGCNLGCPGCINPGTHPLYEGGTWVHTDWLAKLLSDHTPHGHYTFSGGEPLLQWRPLRNLIRALNPKSVIVFTGMSPEIVEYSTFQSVFIPYPGAAGAPLVDVFVAGRYQRSLPPGGPYLSSKNQRLIFHQGSRITRGSMAEPAGYEIHIDSEGNTITTGFPTRSGV